MQVTKLSKRSKKQKIIDELIALRNKYDGIGISNLYKIRAAQLMELRKKFRDQMQIFVVKNKIASLALKKGDSDKYGKFAEQFKGQSALIFTNTDPFKLNIFFEKNRVNLLARPGDIATDDIIISAGNTGIPPGPVLSEFKEVQVTTRIDSGSIWVSKDTIVARKGDIISPKLASLLSRLNIKPISAGLSLISMLYNDLLFYERDLKINFDEYFIQLQEAFINANKIIAESFYPTKETLPNMIAKLELEARSLCIKAGYINKETIMDLLIKCVYDAIIIARETKYTGKDAITNLLTKGSNEALIIQKKIEKS